MLLPFFRCDSTPRRDRRPVRAAAGSAVAALVALSLVLVPGTSAYADEMANSPAAEVAVDGEAKKVDPAPTETTPVETAPVETAVDIPAPPTSTEETPAATVGEPSAETEPSEAAPVGDDSDLDLIVADDAAAIVGRSAEDTSERMDNGLVASEIPVPSNVTATRPYGDVTLRLTWDAVAVDDASVTYSIRSTSSGNTRVSSSTETQWGVTVSDSGSSFYSVAAVVDGVIGEYSSPLEVAEFRYPNSPSAPTNVIATSTSTSISLNWTASDPAPGRSVEVTYYVYVREHGSPYWMYGWYAGQATSFTVTDYVFSGHSYDVGIWGYQDSYSSPYAVVSNIAVGDLPGVPTAFTVEPGDASAVLDWAAPADAGSSTVSSYDLQYGIQGSGAWADVAVASGAAEAIATGLANGTTYVARVRAVNGVGAGAWLESAAFTPIGVPAAVTDFVVQVASEQWYVRWVAGASNGAYISGYEVQYRAAADVTGGWESVSSQWANVSIAGLDHGAYDVRVRAINSVGNGPWVDSAAPVAFAATPDRVVNPAVVANDSGMTVSWEAPENDGGAPVTKYTVAYFSGPLGGPNFAPVYVETTDLSVVISGLENGTEYSAVVSASNAAGFGAYDFMMVTPFAFTPEFTNADGSPITGALQRGDVVVLTGTGVVAGESIEIELHSDPITLATGTVDDDGGYRIEATIPEDAVSGDHTLVAIYGSEDAAVLRTFDVTIAGEVPDAPSFASGYGPASAFEAYWPEAEVLEGDEITSHDVQWRLKGSTEWSNISTTEDTVILPDVENSLTYEIRARATNAWGTSDWSVISEAIPTVFTPTFENEDGTIITDGSSVKAGSTVIMSGVGQNPYMTVGIILHSDPVRLGTSRVAADGSYRLVVKIPATTPVGAHELEPFYFDGGSGNGGSRVSITVTPADVVSPAGTLVVTGLDAGLLASGGFSALVLILVGAMLVVARRRGATN